MNTPVPELNGRSAAQSFMEEHDQLNRELMLAKDAGTQQKEQLLELNIRIESLEATIGMLRNQVAFERSRGDRYAGYAQAMGAMLDPIIAQCESHASLIKASFKKAQQMALEAAQDQVKERVGDLTKDDQEKLTSIAGRLAPNTLS